MKKNENVSRETKKNEYYNLNRILKQNCDYNIIIGERSNGKTYSVLEYALKKYVADGTQTAYIRRWAEDIRQKRAANLFDSIEKNGIVDTITSGEFNKITYTGGKYYLSKWDSDIKKYKLDKKPFCYAFSISEQEHEKSMSYPNVNTIIFDEFLTQKYYLPDEFILFMNLLSTIIRDRENIKIFMLGNTITKICPYFSEFGIDINKLEQGNIDVYQFGQGGAKLAIEFTQNLNKEKKSNKYFSFNNSKLEMIKTGKWSLDVFPHLNTKIKKNDIKFTFFILYAEKIIEGNVIINNSECFIFFHYKTTEIKDPQKQLIYSLNDNTNFHVKRKLLNNNSNIEKKITNFFARDKVFVQNNEIGEIIRNYIKLSMSNNLLKVS